VKTGYASLIRRVKGWGWGLLARPGRRRWIKGLLAGSVCLASLPLWVGYAVLRLAAALVDVLAFPVVSFDRLARTLVAEFGPPQKLEGAELRAWVRGLDCDVWLVPSPQCDCPTGLPSVLVLDDFESEIVSVAEQQEFVFPDKELAAAQAAGATLVVCRPNINGKPKIPGAPRLPPDKLRVLRSPYPSMNGSTMTHTVVEWLNILQEAAQAHREKHANSEDAPLPSEDVPVAKDQPLEALLFLQVFYRGGVWETTKTLLRALVEINRERRLLWLTFAVTEDQDNLHELDELGSELTVERLQMRAINWRQAAQLLGSHRMASVGNGGSEFVAVHAPGAFRSDAWLALADRFTAPLLPLRPYGVVVYDMIQKYVPALFPKEFFDQAKKGMAPTARMARAIVSTNEATQTDVAEAYDLDAKRLTLVPIPCEPHTRFGDLVPEAVSLPSKPFILNVANTGPHKGAPILLRAMARLKARLGEKTPLLVVCGCFTERFAPSFQGAVTDPHWKMVRRLVVDLNLKEGDDVVFLGYADDCQLKDLYKRCSVVVNAAKYDNGTFSLIEGHYFGRSVLSSRYPAAEALYRRFEVPVRYFPIDDDAALAEILAKAVTEPPLGSEELVHVRRRLADPKYSSRRYAEQVYDLLVRLAREGRAERLERSQSETDSFRAA